MGSYKLYVAVMAIAIMAAVQEISCINENAVQYDDQGDLYDDQEDMYYDQGQVDNDQGEVNNEQGNVNFEEEEEPEMQHHQCEEYKSKIWDKAFSNPKAMDLMKLTFNTCKELGSDEVCSDTTRAFFNFVDVMSTNPYTHYSLGMLEKMVGFILREVDTTSDKFKETKVVFERIAKTPAIRDYIKHSTARIVDLLKEPEIRGRLFKVIKAIDGLIKPSENEELVKQKIKGLTNAPSKMAMGAMNTVGRFLRHF